MRPIAKMGMLSSALLWLVTGCAETKPAYVRPAPPARGVDVAEARGVEPAGPRQDPQLDQRMTAMEGRISDMSQRLDKVDGAVAGAQSRAEEAAQKAEGVNSRLTRLWSNRFASCEIMSVLGRLHRGFPETAPRIACTARRS